MSDEAYEQETTTERAEEAKENEEGVGLGYDGNPNTFEPEEDPEATEAPKDPSS